MDEKIKNLIESIIEHDEGGWVMDFNQDNDGGWTYAGVTAKVFNDYMRKHHPEMVPEEGFQSFHISIALEKQSIKNQLDGFIYEIYYEMYFKPLQLEKLPACFWAPLFSCAINCGTITAVKLLQEAIAERVPCSVDGIMGPKTIAMLKDCENQMSVYGYFELIQSFLSNWMRHYINLVQKNHKLIVYLEGWFNRVESYCKISLIEKAMEDV